MTNYKARNLKEKKKVIKYRSKNSFIYGLKPEIN